MSSSRQLVQHLRGAGAAITGPYPRNVLRSPGVTRYTTSAIAQRDVKAWRSRLPSGACIHGNKHTYYTYSSWALSWSLPTTDCSKSKSKKRQRWKPPKFPKFVVREFVLFSALMFASDYCFFLFWKEFQVVAKESHSATISIITVRSSTPDSSTTAFAAARWQTQWKYGIWSLLVSDCLKKFPRAFGGNVSSYTPLPPVDGQDPGDLRLLVHKEEDGNITIDPVHEKLSKIKSLIRMAIPPWISYAASIPEEVQQVVIFASGVTGIAPVLQTIHTLLEARRGDGIVGQTPEIHVVWFKQSLKPVDEHAVYSSDATVLEAWTADKLAGAELERLRLLYPDKLTLEPVDVGGTLTHATRFLESAEQRHSSRGWTFQNSWNPFKTNSEKLLIISGSKGFAESLSAYKDGQSLTEDGPGIISKSKQAGWRILDLSTKKVCN
ncbi:hypothetical protein LCER1_G007942 [Lachnellula cervina]|uniref:Ferric reductase NAD binding domain-containing protein n=1 Tax=Lachnellula cervina TaxID=1316786 RepID=A0A7D8UMQ5_9HELO|nr:hypothetical protein LCER1_G007942 [Lachnellula cervina]